MSGLIRHLRVIAAALRLSTQASLEYRVGFWAEGFVGLVWSLAGAAPLFVALDHRDDVAGWSPWEVVLLTGFFLIIAGVFASSIQPALSESMAKIRTGRLDYLLLRPVDSLVSCLVAAFQPWSLIEILTGLGLIVAAIVQLDLRPGLAELAALVLVFASGLISLFAVGVLILAASFRAMQLQNLTFLMERLLDFAHWPTSVFRGPIKLVFTFVLPLAVMTSYPAQSLLGQLGGAGHHFVERDHQLGRHSVIRECHIGLGNLLAAHALFVGLSQRLLDGRVGFVSGQLELCRHRCTDQHAAGQPKLALGLDDGSGFLWRIDAHIDRQAAAPRVKGRELIGAVADYWHSPRLQVFQRRRQIEDRLGASAYYSHRRLRKFRQIRGNIRCNRAASNLPPATCRL